MQAERPQKNNNERMLIMKKLNRILSLSLATIMALGMFGGAASAADTTTTPMKNGDIMDSVPAYVTYHTGKTPVDAQFEVHMNGLTEAQIKTFGPLTVGSGVEQQLISMSTVSDWNESMIYNFDSDDMANDLDDENLIQTTSSPYFYRLKKDIFIPGPDEVTTPGVYGFIVTQDAVEDKAPTTGMTVDSAKYLAVITYQQKDVWDDDSATEEGDSYSKLCVPVSYVVYNIVEEKGVFKELVKVAEPGDGQKTELCDTETLWYNFVDEYDTTNLKIENHVTGADADTDQDFKYTIDIPVGGTNIDLPEGTKIPFVKYDQDGNKVESDDNYVEVGTTKTVTLKDSEYILFEEVPVGMIFKVTETKTTEDGNTKYSTETQYTSADDNIKQAKAKTADTDNTDNATVGSTQVGSNIYTTETKEDGSGYNLVSFYNNYEIPANTGVSVDIIPYVLVMMAALCGAGLFVSKKRMSR
jgi:hypothetical protein